MHKAYCDEAKAVFLCLMQKKKSQIRLNLRLLAEMVGFEPTCPIKDKTISIVLVTTASIHLQVYFHSKFTICISQIGLEINYLCRRSAYEI